MTSQPHLVVVGASLAGLRAAETSRKAGHVGPITLIGAEEHLPYDRPPLSKAFLERLPDGSPVAPPMLRSREQLVDELGFTLVLGTPATGLDIDGKAVHIGSRSVPFDSLVIATGARGRQLPTQGLAGIHGLRTLDDAIAIRNAMTGGARTVVVGAGFIGSEIASSARKRGLDVTVVESLPTPLVRAVGAEAGQRLGALHERNGTTLICGVSVESFLGDATVTGVRLADGRTLDADLVVVGIGTVPNTEWLCDSGLELDDGIVCDRTLNAGQPGIYAVGDVVRWHNPTFDRLQRLEHWTSAVEQGVIAARNAVHPEQQMACAIVPYFWSDWYDGRIQFVGVPEADELVTIEGADHRGPMVLYRSGDRVVGALTVNGQAVIMKYRNMIGRGATFDEALGFAGHRVA